MSAGHVLLYFVGALAGLAVTGLLIRWDSKERRRLGRMSEEWRKKHL